MKRQRLRNVKVYSPSEALRAQLASLLSPMPEVNVELVTSTGELECSAPTSDGFDLIIVHLLGADFDDVAWNRTSYHPAVIFVFDEHRHGVFEKALRAGANDVFFVPSLLADESVFVRSVQRHLDLAVMADENRMYREELEQSLLELQADQQAAFHVQTSMLPENGIRVGQAQFEYALIPSLMLSGDFVDVVKIDDQKAMFYLADVSGHGASSAMITVLLKSVSYRLVRKYNEAGQPGPLSPRHCLNKINQEILASKVDKHVSIFMAILDYSGEVPTLTYSVGGHHPMPIFATNTDAFYLTGKGMSVGLFDEAIFDEQSIELTEPFRLAMFSDGILELLTQPGSDAQEAFLLDKVRHLSELSPQAIREALLDGDVDVVPDDIAIMTVVGH